MNKVIITHLSNITNQECLCIISAIHPQVGDPQEVNGIVNVFCQSKREPLLIGSTKSNMGHPEPASGMAALAKVKVCFFTFFLF